MSGALVLVGRRLVLKYATGEVAPKVRAEGKFLQGLHPDISPKVHIVGKSWYIMERLEEVPWWADRNLLLKSVVADLRTYFWSQEPTRIRDDWDAFWELIESRSRRFTPHVIKPLYHWMGSLDIRNLRRGLLHNDATLDNVMLRGTRPILTDPLAPRENLPEVLALDVGKLLQSCYGYEWIKRGLEPRVLGLNTVWDEAGLSQNEQSAALFFCAARVSSIIPYFNDPWRRVRLVRIVDRILNQYGTHEA